MLTYCVCKHTVVKREDCLSEDLIQLVNAGTITFQQAMDMMPPKLTPDLKRMVKAGEITAAQAERVMSQTAAGSILIQHCGDMILKGAMTGKEAGAMLNKIQTESQEKHTVMKTKVEEDPDLHAKELMKKKWRTRQAAVDDVKYHSTRQGRRVLVDGPASNGQRTVIICASAKSPNKCDCKYRAVIRQSKKACVSKPWALKKTTKVQDLQHCIRCTSQAKITFREAIKNLNTRDTPKLGSIKETRDRISLDNNITDASVSAYVAAKVRLAEAKQTFGDYHANWSKLDAWCDQLEKRNPGCVFHLDVCPRTDRFKRMFVGLRSAEIVAALTGA